jgi:hypothetical protein
VQLYLEASSALKEASDIKVLLLRVGPFRRDLLHLVRDLHFFVALDQVWFLFQSSLGHRVVFGNLRGILKLASMVYVLTRCFGTPKITNVIRGIRKGKMSPPAQKSKRGTERGRECKRE